MIDHTRIRRDSRNMPEVSDADLEAIADDALGYNDPDFDADDFHAKYDLTKREAADTGRLHKIGIRLTARDVENDKRKSIFIRTLAEIGIVTRAAAAAGWSVNTAYDIRKRDEEFAILWDNAITFSSDTLELVARDRAINGVKRPIYQQGVLAGHEIVYSDALLALMLKAKKPEFREKVDQSLKVSGGVLVMPAQPSSDDWEKMASINQLPHRADSEAIIDAEYTEHKNESINK